MVINSNCLCYLYYWLYKIVITFTSWEYLLVNNDFGVAHPNTNDLLKGLIYLYISDVLLCAFG
jgi:hypothetical protein